MELFFSYGHDEHTPLVKRLAEDLEKPENGGHTVWVDFESIDDTSIDTYDPVWRNSITNGISKSDIVLAFASAHALRDNGVCLDELKIAVFVRGAFVQAVLLEKKIEESVPASISHRQYKDFSEWRDRSIDDKPEGPRFEKWYQGKLEDLLAILSEDVVQSYHDELKRTAELLGLHYPYINTSKQDELAKSSFVGREWLSEMIHEWAKGDEDKRERALVITGSPGMGKSAFVVNEFMRSPDVAAAVFCRFDDPGANNIDAIARSIAYQMAARYDDFRKRLLTVLEEEEALRERGNEPTESAFNRYVFNIAGTMIDGKREYFIILIDGLDEVGLVDGRNPVAKALKRELREGRDFVRFVLTSRNDKHVLGPLESIREIDLDVFAAKGKADVESYVKGKLGWERKRNPEIAKRIEDDPNLAQRIIEASDGNFLYATLACSQIDRLPTKGKLPQDLGDFYEEAMERLRDEIEELGDEIRQLGGETNFYGVREALGIIAASDGDVPEKTLRRAVGWDKGRSRRVYDKFLNCLSMYITESQEASDDEPTLSFFHKSFADWLVSREGAKYSYDRESSRELLANSCFKAYEECVEDGSFDDMNDYEMVNLLPLLEENKKLYKGEYKSKYKEVSTNTDFFDALVDRIGSYKPTKAIQSVEKILSHFPEFDPSTLSGNESLREFARNKALVLHALENPYQRMLRDKDAFQCLEERVKLRHELMLAQPSKDSVEEYVSSVEYALGRGFFDDYKASIRLTDLEALERLVDKAPELDCDIRYELMSIYGSLSSKALRKDRFDDAERAALKSVDLFEDLFLDHATKALGFDEAIEDVAIEPYDGDYALLELNEKGIASELVDLDLFDEPYKRLCDIYARQDKHSEAIDALRRGMDFMRENLSFEAIGADWASLRGSGHLRYEALRRFCSEMTHIVHGADDARLTNGVWEEWLDLLDGILSDSRFGYSEMLYEAARTLKLFFSLVSEDAQRAVLAQRVDARLDALEADADEQDLFRMREDLAELYASIGMYERSNDEYSRALSHELATRSEESVGTWKIINLYSSMAQNEVAIGHDDKAIEYGRLAFDEAKREHFEEGKSLGEALLEIERVFRITGEIDKLDIAYSEFMQMLNAARKFDEAIEIAKERVEAAEAIFDEANRDKDAIRCLKNAYKMLIDCYEKAGRVADETVAAETRVKIYEDVFADDGVIDPSEARFINAAYESLINCYGKMGRVEDIISTAKRWMKKFEMRIKGVRGFLIDYYEKEGLIKEAIAIARVEVVMSEYKQSWKLGFWKHDLYRLEELLRRDDGWREIYGLSLKQLNITEMGAVADGDLRSYAEDILKSMSSHAECILRLEGDAAAKAFLEKRKSANPDVYSRIFQHAASEVESEIRSIERRIKKGEFDDPEIGRKLTKLISVWSGIEAPQPQKSVS